MENKDTFFIKNNDQIILLCLNQYYFNHYNNAPHKIIELNSKLLVNLYYTTLGLDELIYSGWEFFKKTSWNTSDFYDAIGFFNKNFLLEIKKRIENPILYENEGTDPIQNYTIENQELLKNEMTQAIRHHRGHFDFIIDDLIFLSVENEKKIYNLKKEKWMTEL